jgi:hypothetical protein
MSPSFERIALMKQRNKTEKFISIAKAEALSKGYNMLMAWKTWGRNDNKRIRLPARRPRTPKSD